MNSQNVSNSQIHALRAEAMDAGDTAMARLCNEAFDDDEARATVARVIAAAEAMDDDQDDA